MTTHKLVPVTKEQALKALEDMDDFAGMAVSVNAFGARETLRRFIEQAAPAPSGEAATIERCAKVCEEVSANWEALPTPQDCADAIRELASQPAQPQAVKWKVVDVRQALPVTDRQDVYPATRYVYKRLYERDEVCGYAWVELPTFDNDALLRALRNAGKEE